MVNNKLQPVQTESNSLILNLYRTRENLITTKDNSVAYVDRDRIVFSGKYQRSIIIGNTEVNSLKILSDKLLMVCSNHGLLVYDVELGILQDEFFIDEKILYAQVSKYISLLTDTKILVLDYDFNLVRNTEINLFNFYADVSTDLLLIDSEFIYFYNQDISNYKRIENIFTDIEFTEVYDIDVVVIKGTFQGINGLFLFNVVDSAVGQLIQDKTFNFSTNVINITSNEILLIENADIFQKHPEFNTNDFGFVSLSSGPETINTLSNDNIWLVTQEGNQVVVKKYLK